MSANSAPPSTREVMEYALKKGVSEEALGSQCTEEHYLELANKMTGWNEVAPHMLARSAVEEIRGDGCSERDKKLQMLRKWSQRFAFKATYTALIGVFVKAERADLAQLVCDILGDSKEGTGCAREIGHIIIHTCTTPALFYIICIFTCSVFFNLSHHTY